MSGHVSVVAVPDKPVGNVVPVFATAPLLEQAAGQKSYQDDARSITLRTIHRGKLTSPEGPRLTRPYNGQASARHKEPSGNRNSLIMARMPWA